MKIMIEIGADGVKSEFDIIDKKEATKLLSLAYELEKCLLVYYPGAASVSDASRVKEKKSKEKKSGFFNKKLPAKDAGKEV